MQSKPNQPQQHNNHHNNTNHHKKNSFSYEDVLLEPAAAALEGALAGSSVDVEFSLSGEQGLSNFA